MLWPIFDQKKASPFKKRYIYFKMEKPCKLTTRQYMGLVCDLNSRMAQMPPLFDKNQQLDKSELVNSLANKAPRSHKAMLISQGFNPEKGYLATFVEHCERAKSTENIAVAKISASDKDSDTKRHKNRSKKFKEREDNIEKRRKKNASLYCSLHIENKSHTSRECKFLKARDRDKCNPKYWKKDYKNNFKEINLFQAEPAHQKSKYEKLNKAFTKKNTSKEETVIFKLHFR